MVTLTKELPGQLDTRLTESEYRLTERVPLSVRPIAAPLLYVSPRNVQLAGRQRYHGKHREDEVGSLRYSDDDCLASERIGRRIAQCVAQRSQGQR
jgi:hypothetical protein